MWASKIAWKQVYLHFFSSFWNLKCLFYLGFLICFIVSPLAVFSVSTMKLRKWARDKVLSLTGTLGKLALENVLLCVCHLILHLVSGKYVFNSRVSMAGASKGRDDLLVSNGDVKEGFQAAAFESSILSVLLLTAHFHCIFSTGCVFASVADYHTMTHYTDAFPYEVSEIIELFFFPMHNCIPLPAVSPNPCYLSW